MCEYCEKKKPLKGEMFQQFCSIESYVSEIDKDELIFSALIQESDRAPFHVYIKIKGNFCPMCGKRLSEGSKMSEKVNHPSHYQKNGRKECIIEMEEKYGAEITSVFCLTNVSKYIYRAGEKEDNPSDRDISKAKWYFDYTNKLIKKYGTLVFNGIPIEETDLYLDIKEMLGNE